MIRYLNVLGEQLKTSLIFKEISKNVGKNNLFCNVFPLYRLIIAYKGRF